MIISSYTGGIPDEVQAEILTLAELCGVKKDYNSDYDLVYLWLVDGKIVAAITFYLQLFSNGEVIPKWMHTFYDPKVRTTKGAYAFLKEVLQILAKDYSRVCAYVRPKEDFMRIYALRVGFVPYSNDADGTYLVLNFTRNEVSP